MIVNIFINFVALLRLVTCYQWSLDTFKSSLNQDKVNFNIGAVLVSHHFAQFFQVNYFNYILVVIQDLLHTFVLFYRLIFKGC